MGKVRRPFKEKHPNYDDVNVIKYLETIGDTPANYDKYGVVPRDILSSRTSLLRYNRHPDPYSDYIKSLYDIAGDWLEKEYGKALSDTRVLSYDEVLTWLKPVKSPGYPWTLQHPFKIDYWNSLDAEFFIKYWNALATDDYIKTLCSVSIKEEIRPKDKIEKGEVRTIIAMDVNHVVSHCQLTLDQNNNLIATCTPNDTFNHSSALGLNTLKGGFHKLNFRMRRFGRKNTIELDGKKFDGRFRKYHFDKIRDFRFKMLRREFRTEANKKRMHNLYAELTDSPLVNVDGTVYERNCGNPSGQGCTTPDNTFKNNMDIWVLWLIIMPKEYHTYEQFRYYVELCICGDDINISVHEDVKHLFNPDSIRKHMGDIDMEYHFASDDFRDNSDCTFLGHGFKLCDIPELGYPMYFPIIDCLRMRSNMLIYNEKGTVSNSIIRACGLRNETFACESCRDWFMGYIEYLKVHFPGENDPDIREAWKNYLTDREIWMIYSGHSVVQGEKSVNLNTAKPDFVLQSKCCAAATHKFNSLSALNYRYILNMTKTKSQRARAKRANKSKPKSKGKESKPAARAANFNTGSAASVTAFRSGAQSRTTRPKTLAHTSLKSYLKALADPFSSPPGKLGFGTFVPTGVHQGWRTLTLAVPSTSTAFNFNVQPTMDATAYQFSAATNSVTTLLGGFQANYGPANSTTLLLLSDSARIISCGLRVCVRYAATSIRGRVGGIYLPDETIDKCDLMTYDGIQNLSGFRDFHSDASGEIGGQVTYRPVDTESFDFEFSRVTGYTTASPAPILMINGTGFLPDSFEVDISIFTVWETLGGLDAAGEDDYTAPAFGVQEIAGGLQQTPNPVVTDINWVTSLDKAASNINRSMQRYGSLGKGAGSLVTGPATVGKIGPDGVRKPFVSSSVGSERHITDLSTTLGHLSLDGTPIVSSIPPPSDTSRNRSYDDCDMKVRMEDSPVIKSE